MYLKKKQFRIDPFLILVLRFDIDVNQVPNKFIISAFYKITCTKAAVIFLLYSLGFPFNGTIPVNLFLDF